MIPAQVLVNPLAGRPEVWAPYDRAPFEVHRRLPGYEPTPLLPAPALAAQLGVSRLLLKCELSRFGLPAFKLLGASWATYRAVVERLGAEPAWETVADLAAAVKGLRPMALATATDGNHGRAVARMAAWLGFDSRIFVPAGTSPARIEAIESEGATVTVVAGVYEDAVAAAAETAGDRCLVISDTSWPGYEQVPRWIIEGYSTMFWEISDRLDHADAAVVPIGVGALAAAAVNHWGRESEGPALIGVEPIGADCVMASARAGEPTTVPGPHRSIMVGLNCGLPSLVSWPLVAAGFATLVAIDDEWARQAVRDLAGMGVEAGETGAAAVAGLAALQSGPHRLPADFTVVAICTEGVTDPDMRTQILGSGSAGPRSAPGS